MFISAHASDRASELAAGFAALAAQRVSTACWLLDLDLFANRQFRRHGGDTNALQGPFDMAFGQDPFWQITPRARHSEQARSALVGWRVPESRLFVSAFDRAVLDSDQTVKVAPAPAYWAAVRHRVDLTVVDAPPLERSRVGLALVQDMDGVILVANPNKSDPNMLAEIRDEVMARHGRWLGLVTTEDVGPSSGGLFGRMMRPVPGAEAR
jgi:Mrp family chromosome partitioning ATPase